MTEQQTENWPLSPVGILGLLVSLLGLGLIIAGGFELLDQGLAYTIGLFSLFGGIVTYFYVSWVLD